MVGDKRNFNVILVTLKAKGTTGELPGGDELDDPLFVSLCLSLSLSVSPLPLSVSLCLSLSLSCQKPASFGCIRI